jgi:hypothetical protein
MAGLLTAQCHRLASRAGAILRLDAIHWSIFFRGLLGNQLRQRHVEEEKGTEAAA